ncbi:MAG: hypothetical protein OFPII_37400 [Osedax symbiont Rs1]|nr:MAG: hypothetical protein OFPII_37400 [Osedax symbiont Rs1]
MCILSRFLTPDYQAQLSYPRVSYAEVSNYYFLWQHCANMIFTIKIY